MSASTVKPGLTRKRAKRVVENDEFAAFTRRILAAYARRIASGDIEALPSLSQLSAEVDAAMREAVRGLRRFGYSWADIAARLGVSRQAVQMRYGTPDDRGALDRRLLSTGLGVSVQVLAAVFADHCRGLSPAPVCTGCGYVFDPADEDCPTNRVVRPLLRRRKHESPRALHALTAAQLAELEVKPRHTNGAKPPVQGEVGELFSANGHRRYPRNGHEPAPRRRSR